MERFEIFANPVLVTIIQYIYFLLIRIHIYIHIFSVDNLRRLFCEMQLYVL